MDAAEPSLTDLAPPPCKVMMSGVTNENVRADGRRLE